MTNLVNLNKAHSYNLSETGAPAPAAAAAFNTWREAALAPLERAAGLWNEAVAEVISHMGLALDSHVRRSRGEDWVRRAALSLRTMRQPLKSDVILSTIAPAGANAVISGAVRAFSTTVLEQDLEFMPKRFRYPKFAYFEVEPATQASLATRGLYLLAGGPPVDEDEGCDPGTAINRHTYLRTPLISLELSMKALAETEEGAVLINWSCRGRNGAMGKVFINGELDVPPFEIMTTADDATPNFWTILPWDEGGATIDLKLVGEASYLWFEHADVHVLRWLA